MKKITVLLLIIAFFSCKNKSDNSSIVSNDEDTTLVGVDKDKIDHSFLYGVWAENEEDNAIFEIGVDSLRYVEFYNNAYYYEVKDSHLMIYLEEGYVSNNEIVKVSNDSLILKSDNEETLRFYKRKE